MISLTDLQHRFGFTRNEVALILFLSLSLMAGAGIRWIRSDGREGTEIPTASRYAASDSEFAARSLAAAADTGLPGPVTRSHPFPRKPPLPAASVDINSATPAELVQLPGIGDAYARRIVAYRDGHGRFSRVDDIMRVAGIGPKKFQALRPFVTAR
jgi:competence ComEA-like helix-hairpin-helix protein